MSTESWKDQCWTEHGATWTDQCWTEHGASAYKTSTGHCRTATTCTAPFCWQQHGVAKGNGSDPDSYEDECKTAHCGADKCWGWYSSSGSNAYTNNTSFCKTGATCTRDFCWSQYGDTNKTE